MIKPYNNIWLTINSWKSRIYFCLILEHLPDLTKSSSSEQDSHIWFVFQLSRSFPNQSIALKLFWVSNCFRSDEKLTWTTANPVICALRWSMRTSKASWIASISKILLSWSLLNSLTPFLRKIPHFSHVWSLCCGAGGSVPRILSLRCSKTLFSRTNFSFSRRKSSIRDRWTSPLTSSDLVSS